MQVLRGSWDEKFKVARQSLSRGHGIAISSALNISLTSSNDFGTYRCHADNARGAAEAAVELYEVRLGSLAPPPLLRGSEPLVTGQRPPPFADARQLCPPPAPLQPDPAAAETEDNRSLRDKCGLFDRSKMTIVPYEGSLHGPGLRKEHCRLQKVGKPVLKRNPRGPPDDDAEADFNMEDPYGAWMVDSFSGASETLSEKVWETKSDHRLEECYRSVLILGF